MFVAIEVPTGVMRAPMPRARHALEDTRSTLRWEDHLQRRDVVGHSIVRSTPTPPRRQVGAPVARTLFVAGSCFSPSCRIAGHPTSSTAGVPLTATVTSAIKGVRLASTRRPLTTNLGHGSTRRVRRYLPV